MKLTSFTRVINIFKKFIFHILLFYNKLKNNILDLKIRIIPSIFQKKILSKWQPSANRILFDSFKREIE